MKISSKDPEKKTKLYLGIWWWASTSKTCEEHPCKCSQHNQHNNSDLLPCLNIPRSPRQKMRKRVDLCGGTEMACYLPDHLNLIFFYFKLIFFLVFSDDFDILI